MPLAVWVLDTVDDAAAGFPRGEALAVVRVCGEVDLTTAATLDETVERAQRSTSARAARSVVVDCSAMTFCSGRGLAVLHRSARRAADHGVGYAITGLSTRLTRLMADLWPAPAPTHHPTVAEAIMALRAASTMSSDPLGCSTRPRGRVARGSRITTAA